jgi:hypothetical protein
MTEHDKEDILEEIRDLREEMHKSNRNLSMTISVLFFCLMVFILGLKSCG